MEYTGCSNCVNENLWSHEEPCCFCRHSGRGGRDEHFKPKLSLATINAKLDKIMKKLGIMS